MGYHRPVSVFNTGKKAEFKERRAFLESKTEKLMGNDNDEEIHSQTS